MRRIDTHATKPGGWLMLVWLVSLTLSQVLAQSGRVSRDFNTNSQQGTGSSFTKPGLNSTLAFVHRPDGLLAGLLQSVDRNDQPALISVTAPKALPGLYLTKRVNKSRAAVGDTLTYIISLVNKGLAASGNLSIRDSLDANLAFVSATASAGSFTAAAPGGTWSLNTVVPGDSVTLTIRARILLDGLVYNTASLPGVDTVQACTSVPIKVCRGSEYQFVLSVKSGYSRYQWYRGSALVQDSPVNSFTVSTPGEYRVVADSLAGQCADLSCCPFIVEEDTIPAFKVFAAAATCSNNTPQSNGQIVVTGLSTAFHYQISPGTSFTAATPLADTAQVPANGVLAVNLAAVATSTPYTIRVYNALGCYADQTVLLPPTICTCPPARCATTVVALTRTRRPTQGTSLRKSQQTPGSPPQLDGNGR
ncbi:DUF11 domain-containing protein [Fibrisoma limi]|nr:DUF11 domain-containing protein [Fibrisoma limi]